MVLTSKERYWTIRKGDKFTAIQIPEFKTPTEFIADADMSVVYKGKLLELQEEANKKGFIRDKIAKRNNVIFGGAGVSFSAILLWLKKKLKGVKVTKKKEKV